MLRRFIYMICVLLAAALVSGCSDEESAVVDRSGVTLMLHIDMSPSSRAVAEGYGTEDGRTNENRIDNLCLFFYRSALGPNDDALITNKVYVSSEQFSASAGDNSVECTVKLDFHPSAGDRIIVLANMGNVAGITSLTDLRNYVAEYAWKQTWRLSEADSFAMSSAYDNDGVVTDIPGDLSTWRTSVTVERLAARIDLWYDAANIAPSGDALVYSTKDSRAKVYITDVLPVNVNRQPTWALKHFTKVETPDDFSSLAVCSHEYLGDDGLPANYVVEPNTVAKNSFSASLDNLFGGSRASFVETNYKNLFGTETAMGTYLSDPTLSLATSGEHSTALTVTYANENTQHKDASTSAHITGLLLKARFEPAEVIGADGAAHSYVSGSDFWRCHIGGDSADSELYFDSSEAYEAWRQNNPAVFSEATRYERGECYYTVWFRHRIDEPAGTDTSFRMQYATVRNHIYRLSFRFSGPGTNEPEIDNPENVEVVIYVRKWNFRRLNEIIM